MGKIDKLKEGFEHFGKVTQTGGEFNLSEKIEESPSSQAMILYLPSVKEFIKELKKELLKELLQLDATKEERFEIYSVIDKLAGDKLSP